MEAESTKDESPANSFQEQEKKLKNNAVEEKAWAPSQAWLDKWKKKKQADLEPILRLINGLYPAVEKFSQGEDGGVDTDQVLQYLASTTAVGILPQPHAIVIRTYSPNAYTSLWFSTYLWGVIFTRNQALPYFDWRKIKLILIVR